MSKLEAADGINQPAFSRSWFHRFPPVELAFSGTRSIIFSLGKNTLPKKSPGGAIAQITSARGEHLRLALISDIHGNTTGLKAVLAQMQKWAE